MGGKHSKESQQKSVWQLNEDLEPSFFLQKNFEGYLKEHFASKSTENLHKVCEEALQTIQRLHLVPMMKTYFELHLVLDNIPKLRHLQTDEIDPYLLFEIGIKESINFQRTQVPQEFFVDSDIKNYQFCEQMALALLAQNQSSKLIGETSKNFLKKFNYDPGEKILNQKSLFYLAVGSGLEFEYDGDPPSEKITLGFIHSSIRNYFLARHFLNNVSKNILPDWISEVPVFEEDALVQILAISIQGKEVLIDFLLKQLLNTREQPQPNSIKASNLITILVAANVSFFGQDLSHLNLSNAKLTDGIFSKCNFSFSNLTNSTLDNCKFGEANFEGTILKNIKRNNFDFIRTKEMVNRLCFSHDERRLLTADENNVIFYDLESNSQINTFKETATAIALSPKGDKFACATKKSNNIKIYDIPSEKLILTLKGHPSPPIEIFYDQESTIVRRLR